MEKKRRRRKCSTLHNASTPLRDFAINGETHPSIQLSAPRPESPVRILGLRNAALRLISDYLRGLGEPETP